MLRVPRTEENIGVLKKFGHTTFHFIYQVYNCSVYGGRSVDKYVAEVRSHFDVIATESVRLRTLFEVLPGYIFRDVVLRGCPRCL
jgi:hypothetical protein